MDNFCAAATACGLLRGMGIRTAQITSLALLLAIAGCDAGEVGQETAPSTASTASAGDDAVQTSVSPPDTAARTTEAPTAPSAQVAWHEDLTPVSGPRLVDGVLVLYAVEDEQLLLVALDPESGTELWRKMSSASDITPARPLQVEVADGRVVHLQPGLGADGESEAAALALARDPRSGESEGPKDFTNRVHAQAPSRCPGSSSDVCTSPLSPDGQLDFPQVLENGTGAHDWAPGGDPRAMTFVERIGPMDLARGEHPRLGRLRAGGLLWSASTTDLVGPSASTNSGWEFVGWKKELLIGSVGLTHDFAQDDMDLTGSAVFALDAETGERRWISRKSDLACNTSLYSAGGALTACRYDAGTTSFTDDGRVLRDTEVSVVRLDPETGKTRWSVPVMEGDLDGLLVPGVVDEQHVAVAGQVIDTADGSSREQTGDDVVWYPSRSRIPLDRPGTDYSFVTGADTWRVSGDRDASAEELAWPLPPGVGVELDDGTRVVAHDHGLTAFSAP